ATPPRPARRARAVGPRRARPLAAPCRARGVQLAGARRFGRDLVPRGFSGSSPVRLYDAPHRVSNHRPSEALQVELAQLVGLDLVPDRRVHTLRDQRLTRLRGGAKAGGKVADRAERAVVVASLEPDPSERCVAGRDSDPQSEVDPALAPACGELLEALLR